MFRLLSAIFVLAMLGCGSSQGPHKPVTAPTKAAGGAGGTPGFDTLKPVFQKYCSTCHPGRQANNWLDYGQAKANAATIKNRVWTNRTAPNQMPQAGSPESTAISEAERKMIADWADAGAPEKGGAAATAGGGGPAGTGSAAAAGGKLQACFSCHGEGGRGNSAQAAPALAGQKEEYIFNQLWAFQTTLRQDPSGAMNAQMADKSVEDMREYAKELAKLPAFYDGKAPLELKEPAKYAVGMEIAQNNCVGCHARTDDDSYKETPYLNGQGKTYLMRQLVRFHEKIRKNDIMNGIAEDLTNENIEALATYFSQSRL